MPLFQSESTCEAFHMKMSSARSFFFMQIKVIFIRMVSDLDSHETEAQGNSEMAYYQRANTKLRGSNPIVKLAAKGSKSGIDHV